MKPLLILLLTASTLLATGSLPAAEVLVFAAASLSDALRKVAAMYEERSSDRVVFNFAGSGLLARQIEEGAPADLFYSADEATADRLEGQGLLAAGTRSRRIGNSLVIITAPNGPEIRGPESLTDASVRRVAWGNCRTVPAGAYARTWLERVGLWRALEARAVPCENVRAVLAAVQSGNVDAGIVYRTDAMISRQVRVAYVVPDEAQPQITYAVAMLRQARNPAAARRFLSFLNSGAADPVFLEAGFLVPETREEP